MIQKLFLTLSFLIGTIVVQAQEIKWLTLNEALTLQKENPKPIFMDVYTDWCGPCKYLDKTSFSDENFKNYMNQNYYMVKFNAEGKSIVNYKEKTYSNISYNPAKKGRNATHDFTKFLQVMGYPTMVIFDKEGTIKESVLGYKTANELLEIVKIK